MSVPGIRTGTDYPGAAFDTEWRRLVAPSGYVNPEPRPRYHLVVIGAGPAGLVTAIAAAGLGANVALVEGQAMGGDCLNSGCVPSKALLEFTARTAGAQDFDGAFEWLRQVRARIAQHDSVERYTQAGVDVFLGAARFVDDERVEVAGRTLPARRTVIATGSSPVHPPIPGLAEAEPHTNETIFSLQTRPERLAILGAGPVGCELAQAFARAGVGVDLLEAAPRVLAREHPDASRAVAESLAADGVRLHTGAEITSVTRRSSGGITIVTSAAEFTADELLVAAGRRANTEQLNLAAAGVETDAAGLIAVDARLRTSNPRIYAAGDVCSPLQFTHHADAHARIVVQNALFAPTATTKHLRVPRCTYTQPEIAQIGELPEALEQRGVAYDVYRQPFSTLDRGCAQDDRDGFAEIVTRAGKPEILGATIVGRDAGEQIAALVIALGNGLGLDALGRGLLPYPTLAEFMSRSADDYNRRRLTPFTRRLIGTWLKWRA